MNPTSDSYQQAPKRSCLTFLIPLRNKPIPLTALAAGKEKVLKSKKRRGSEKLTAREFAKEVGISLEEEILTDGTTGRSTNPSNPIDFGLHGNTGRTAISKARSLPLHTPQIWDSEFWQPETQPDMVSSSSASYPTAESYLSVYEPKNSRRFSQSYAEKGRFKITVNGSDDDFKGTQVVPDEYNCKEWQRKRRPNNHLAD